MGRHWDLKCPSPVCPFSRFNTALPQVTLGTFESKISASMASVDLDDLMKINIIGIVNNLYIDKRHQSLQGIRIVSGPVG